MNPKVSVILPNYNHSAYLDERIQSILNQTYTDFELIILDDCSPDNSLEVIQKYASHPKVSHIVANEKNSGSTFIQWDKGIELAKGEYIWIAESDDYASPDFLAKLMAHMGADPQIVLGFSSLYWVDENSKIIRESPLKTYKFSPASSGEFFIKHNMLYGCHILNASSAVFKKSAIAQIPTDYKTYKGSGDYLFWIELAKQGKVLKIEEPLDYFRIHSQKVTTNSVASGRQFVEGHQIYKRLIELGYVKGLMRKTVPGFWLTRIEAEKTKFNSEEIYTQVRQLWEKEAGCPKMAKTLYYMNGIIRTIIKKII